jgi:hypothetical protein
LKLVSEDLSKAKAAPEPSREPVVGPSTRAPSPAHSPESGRRFAKSAHIRIVKDQLKVANAPAASDAGRSFEFFCDEPPELGGDDRFPQPLTYIAAAVGF